MGANTKPESGTSDFERALQLLCLIAQSLARIEKQLGSQQQQPKQHGNVISFPIAGGRR